MAARRAPQAGLARFASDKISSLSRYIKIAATLPNKSVRDVALRVRWIGRKDTPRKQRTKARRRRGAPGSQLATLADAPRARTAQMLPPPPPPVDAPLPAPPKRSRTPKEPRTEGSRPGGSHAFSMGPPAVSHMGSRGMGGSHHHGGGGGLAHGGGVGHARRHPVDLAHFPPPPLPLLSADELAAQGVRRDCRRHHKARARAFFHVGRCADAAPRVRAQGHVTGSTTELLDANVGLAHGIKASLGASQLGASASQLCAFRDNILAILHRMATLPGMMAQMPPLPVRPNLELASAVLPASGASLQS